MNPPTHETTAAARPIPQEAFDWYDEYAHGVIDRRTFLARLTGAGLALPMLLAALTPDYAAAQQVSFNDPDIEATYATFASPDGHGEGRGYLVVPTGVPKKRAAVLVIHENRGLNPYVKDVARRAAKAGFVAFAPDALHPAGGYPGNDDKGRAMQKKLNRAKIEQDFIAAAQFLKTHDATNAGGQGAAPECSWAAAGAVGRTRQARERLVARIRSRPEGGGRGLRHAYVPRGPARVSQRLDRALRPGPGGPGMEAHGGVF